MIHLLALISLLPWGANAAAYSARINNSADLITGHALILSASETPAKDRNAARQWSGPAVGLAPKRCRGARLPGFSCTPDPAIHMTLADRSPFGSRGGFLPTGDWTGASAPEAPPTGPPRSI